MSFLVILISLTVNYLWLRDYDRFDDGWFFRFRRQMEKVSQQTAGKLPASWPVALVLTYTIPLLLLLALLLFINGRAYGIPEMLLHILVLLVAFDRTQPGQLSRQFLASWKAGDYAGCEALVRSELTTAAAHQFDSPSQLSDFFSQQLTYRWFERMFVMFFWYMLGGPLAILFCYITYQLRDSHRDEQPETEVHAVSWFLTLLEWIPLRLLALTFSLAGNFVTCFERVKQSFWEVSRDFDAAGMLSGYARCAVSGMVAAPSETEVDNDCTADVAGMAVTDKAQQRQIAAEITALQGLLERSQAIWLAVLALITIFAIP